MENYSNRHNESIKKALEEVGFKVDEIHKKGRKTVITVSRNEIFNEIINLQDKEIKINFDD